MRHAKARYQLNRFTSWRQATLVNLAKNLLIHQSLRTTKPKAKAVRPLIDKLISLAKLNTLSARRQAFRILGDHKLVNLLFNDMGVRFNHRTGGYSRIIGLGSRRGDNAELVILELTEIKKKEPIKPKKEKEIKPEKEETVKEEKPKEKEIAIKEKPPISKKPAKKFLMGLRNIFKKERDAL